MESSRSATSRQSRSSKLQHLFLPDSLPSPAAKVVIRVTGDSPSTIAGTLTSNGSIVLINEHGLTITETGSINCHALTGNTGESSTASIVNEGTIHCTKTVLLASRGHVANTHAICTPGGRIILQGSMVQVKGTLDVSEKNGGGTICIGGGFHGEDRLITNAKLTVCNLIWLRLPICCDLLLVRSTLWSRRKSQHLGNLAHPNCSVYSCPIPYDCVVKISEHTHFVLPTGSCGGFTGSRC